MLTPTQILQRLPIDFAELKSGNNSKNLLNEIRHIVFFFVPIKTNYQQSI